MKRENNLSIAMFATNHPCLCINHVGQLVFIQDNYLIDIGGVAEVPVMGGLVLKHVAKSERDMYNYINN